MPEGQQAPPAVCLVGGPRAGQQEAVRQQEGGAGLVSGRRGSSWQEDTHVPKREQPVCGGSGLWDSGEGGAVGMGKVRDMEGARTRDA